MQRTPMQIKGNWPPDATRSVNACSRARCARWARSGQARCAGLRKGEPSHADYAAPTVSSRTAVQGSPKMGFSAAACSPALAGETFPSALAGRGSTIRGLGAPSRPSVRQGSREDHPGSGLPLRPTKGLVGQQARRPYPGVAWRVAGRSQTQGELRAFQAGHVKACRRSPTDTARKNRNAM